MGQRGIFIGGLGILVLLMVGLILLTTQLTPEQTNPAYAAAVTFMEAAGRGDDAAASALLGGDLPAYVAANCPDGSVSACIQGYTPPEWGDLVHAEYRRADTSGQHIQLFATYEEGVGFSGVCIYMHVLPANDAGTDYRVVAWSGFIHCGQPNAGLDSLRSDPSVPNRAP